jgi:hypothetical protein
MDTMAVKNLRRVLVILLLFSIAAGTTACRSDDEKNEQQQHLESMMAILVQVQKNLGRIRQKEAVVQRLSSDVEGAQEKSAEEIGREIYDNIRFIDSTLASSKSLISRMEKENSTSGMRVAALDRLTKDLKGEVEAKDREIAALKQSASRLNGEVSRLYSTVDVMDEVIDDQEEQLSTAYYISGTVDQLASKGILVRQGPFARVLGSNYLLANDFDTNAFHKIDIGETRDIFFDKPLKSLHIITPHTRGSYDIVGGRDATLLLVRDENEFWRKSRCLVIVVE